jgi:electron transfer flavoprotein alpha subunit
MPNGVLVVAETRDGTLRGVSAEVASAGRRIADALGGPCSALVIGVEGGEQVAGLGAYGMEKVLVAQAEGLTAFSGGNWAQVVLAAVARLDPAVVLLAATSTGRDLAPRIAAALEAGYAASCTELAIEDGALTAVRPVYAGKAFQKVRITTPVAVASLRPKNFAVDADRGTAPEVTPLDVPAASDREQGSAVEAAAGGAVDLTEADRIVSGGRGMGGVDNWPLLEELAAALGAQLGASRAVVDAGWRPHAEQVGQTGKTVTPQLYVACGISGAMQHLAGMSRSRVIVAVNRDKDAPIFTVADYGIVGDVKEVLPALAAEVRRLGE